jgi:hypothetical protein
MLSEITIVINKSVLDKAKIYAKNNGKCLSELIEKYLIIITSEEKRDNELSPKMKKIVGAVILPNDFDEEKELRSYLKNKHI